MIMIGLSWLVFYRLLTIEVQEDYTSYKMAFASTYVADYVSGEFILIDIFNEAWKSQHFVVIACLQQNC